MFIIYGLFYKGTIFHVNSLGELWNNNDDYEKPLNKW